MEAVGGECNAAVALEFPAGGPLSPTKLPARIRLRLLEPKSSAPATVEEIEAKLREAHLRRQQFHESLSFKARSKPRSPLASPRGEDFAQRIEEKLYAAEQKRLSLIGKEQLRLARLDELRQAAKTELEMRLEKEREELGTRVESRVQQAEANRMRILKARMQRRAAFRERKARSLLQWVIREKKYKECLHSAFIQKHIAAEQKRMGLLEAEIRRARARVTQARRIAKTISQRREIERRQIKEELENRLQKAKRQRAEYLKIRGSTHSTEHIIWKKNRNSLSKKLVKCWRRFVRSKKTTFTLAKAFETLGINGNSSMFMPYDQLVRRIESDLVIQTVKALLQRLETRLVLSRPNSLGPTNIDHLLKHLAIPNQKTAPGKVTRIKGSVKKGSTQDCRSSEANRLSRYPVRVVLAAYMILGHPTVIFNELGESEAALVESAENFISEFELLVNLILDSRLLLPDVLTNDYDAHQESTESPRPQSFRSQLAAFDMAWSCYLFCFVSWKVKDARSLEEDLVRAACQLEISMIQTCKLTAEHEIQDLSHGMKAIQKQVTEDQKLLREEVRHLSGIAGIKRMDDALSDTRSKFFEAKEIKTSPISLAVHIPSPEISSSLTQAMESVSEKHSIEDTGSSSRGMSSLFGTGSSLPSVAMAETQNIVAQPTCSTGKHSPTQNELLVNEIMHGSADTFTNKEDMNEEDGSSIKAKIKETMEKAFWDGIMESLNEDELDYGRIIGFVKEVRDELCEMAPQSWKQEIHDSIDVDILSQVLESGTKDTDYLGRILEYSLVLLQRLSAPANEEDMKKTHKKLLKELACIAQSGDKRNNSFVLATIKGLRFVLEQIQTLKKEISKARIQMIEPIIRGSAGSDYLQKAFSDRYGPPSSAANCLPQTVQWISSIKTGLDDEWNEHTDSLSLLPINNVPSLVTTLRTGGSVPLLSKQSSAVNSSGGDEKPECSGEKVDVLLRLGLLKLTSGIEGLTGETVPETFILNTLRLRAVQSQLQHIIVISTSMLVIRQILVSENSAFSPSQIESITSDSLKRLLELLGRGVEFGMEEILEAVVGPSPDDTLQSKKEVMARLLTKSLQKDDPVFTKVSGSIYMAARGVVLGGSGARGRGMADVALRRVGASVLLDRVVRAAERLIVLADVSARVHEPWYRSLIGMNE